jgi:hypothetical protein
MQRLGRRLIVLTAGALLASSAIVWGQQHLSSEPAHAAGQGVTPAFEGWFHNPDGTFSIMVGYYNRNMKQEVDVPIGPENKIEPGGPDRGQPTHFMPGRGWGPFVIVVPKDFGDKELTWTLTVNGQTNSIPINTKPLWEISPFVDALNNTPPWLSFQPLDEGGPTLAGPKPLVISKTAKVGVPMPITAYVADDGVFSPGRSAPKNLVTVFWAMLRGPAPVKFDPEKPTVEKVDVKKMPKAAIFAGKATTQVTFQEPGDYLIYLSVNDASGVGGGNGFQCCWTNGHVKVTVTK